MKKIHVILFDIFVLVAVALFAFVMILGHVWVARATVVVVPGSYGETFASDNNLKVVGLADSQKNQLSLRYGDVEDEEKENDTDEKSEEEELILPLEEIPFEYNLNGEEAEIVYYSGDDDMVVIPAYIDGHPVTTVAMDLVGTGSVYVIPDTVTSITGEVVMYLTTTTFVIEMIFSILAFLLTLIIVNILLPRYNKSISEYLLTGSQMVASVIYVIAQTAFGIISIHFLWNSPYLALIISLVILGIYLMIVFLGGAGRRHVKDADERIAVKTENMKEIKMMAKSLADGISDPDLKKQVQRLSEDIRFSDSVSRADLADIEDEIRTKLGELCAARDSGDQGEMKRMADEISKLLAERNRRCKAGK